MDDAGGGTRGLKPTITPAVTHAVQRTWDLELDRAVALGGSTGLNLLVDACHGRVVVRAHRAHVSGARVHALQVAREAAALGGVPTARTILRRHGERHACTDSWVIEVEEFINSDAKMGALARTRQAMPLLARLHAALERAGLPDAADDLRLAEAVVWFRSEYIPTRERRAVLFGDRWKVSRATAPSPLSSEADPGRRRRRATLEPAEVS